MRIITCNIRASSMGNDFNERSWHARGAFCIQTVMKHSPDVIVLQECCLDQLTDFQKTLGEEWATYAMMIDPEWDVPENAILYRKSLGALQNCGGYWLSETPHIPGSVSWNSECVRFANYVVLETSEGRIRIINTHIDHASQLAREKQSGMLCQDAEAWPTALPQILTGDLNCDVTNPAIQLLMSHGWRDSYAEATGIANERFTAHEFQGENLDEACPLRHVGKMDWILLRGGISCTASFLVMDHEGILYPSDHYFVVADLRIA